MVACNLDLKPAYKVTPAGQKRHHTNETGTIVSIPSEWPGIFLVRLSENTDSSIPGGAPRSPALRDVHIQQLDRRPPHLHGVELVSLFLILPSLRTFCHNGPLGQHFTLKLEWFIGQSLVENVTFSRLHSKQANIESILLSFKALRNLYISYETQSWLTRGTSGLYFRVPDFKLCQASFWLVQKM